MAERVEQRYYDRYRHPPRWGAPLAALAIFLALAVGVGVVVLGLGNLLRQTAWGERHEVAVDLLIGNLTIASLMLPAAAAARVAFGRAPSDLLSVWWLNTSYLLFGIATFLAVHVTGGLEVSATMHAVNNLVATVPLLTHGFVVEDRDAGSADAGALLVPALAFVVLAAVAWWSRRDALAVATTRT